MNTRAEHAALLNAIKLASQCNSITEVVTRTLPAGEHSAHFHQGFYRQVRQVINGNQQDAPASFPQPQALHRDAYKYGIECAKAAGFDDVMQEVCNAQTLPRDMRMPE